ncbi:Pectate lyase superfamily protein [uncultured Caudovirales phage]|uniref:Pectate lyase superfamily protein n=1 Tax=uncultured Caudovirales phage TaxID=2100421 RepID=A0A6J5L2P1_9CAUD|nr:Pectate lyase superfamily protein [uncultured Caudovirales phage]CAB4133058.1 Pectate lyase superfamily protein [uncultured Caudovirales phage]
MAGTKISELPVATTPLTGTELVPVVQAGVTDQTTVAKILGTAAGASLIVNTPSGTISSTTVQGAINEIVTDLSANTGSTLVGYTQGGTGAVTRTAQAKMRETVSVLDFGAVGDGVTDDTAAFTAAMNAATGEIVLDPTKTYAVNLTITKRGTRINGRSGDNISVAGSPVKNLIPYDPTKPVIQIANDAAYAGGVVVENLSIWSQSPSGTQGQIGMYLAGGAYACTIRNVQIGNQFSVHNLKLSGGNTYPNAYNQFIGLQLWTLGGVSQTATLGIYYGGTYCTANYFSHFNITGPSGAGTGYAIQIDSCEALMVNGWVQASHNKGINFAKSWSAAPWLKGSNVIVDSDSSSDVLITSTVASDTAILPINFLTGGVTVDGLYKNAAGTSTATPYASYLPYQSLFAYPISYGYAQTFNPTTGNNVTTVGGPFGANNSQNFGDSTVTGYATYGGGSGGVYFAVSGTSIVTVQAAYMAPQADNTKNLGIAGQRWATVYAGTGTINTSDGREKQQVRDLTTAERAVAVAVKGMLRAFKFNDAVEKKGDGARIHFGVIAQDVKAAFEAEGLNANDYALFCYDEWPEQPEILGENGEVMRAHIPAGNRYGVRYEELLAFIIAAI